MSQTPASEPTPPEGDPETAVEPGDGPKSPQPEDRRSGAQDSPQQPYDQLAYAQQYGQPAPEDGPQTEAEPGGTAPLTEYGAQQYGQPQQGTPTFEPQQYGHGEPYEGRSTYEGQQANAQQQPYQAQQAPYQPQPYQPQPHQGQAYGGQQAYAPGPGRYPAQPGPTPYGQPPLSQNDERLWATLTHVSIPFFGFVGPVIAYLVLKDRSAWLKESVTEALNFSILVSVSLLVSALLTFVLIGFVLVPVIAVATLVLCILAAIASSRGEQYRYPLNWRLVK